MSFNVSLYWPAFVVLLGVTTLLPLLDGSPMSTSRLPLGTLYASRMTGWQVALLIHVTCSALLALGFSLIMRLYLSIDSQKEKAVKENISDNRLSLTNQLFQLSAVSILFGLAVLIGIRSPLIFAAIAAPFVMRFALAWLSTANNHLEK